MRDYAFGDRLSALRQECGYSQFQLATLIGVSDKAVSKWETGVAKPRIKTCHRLAAALGVDLDDLFSQSEHSSSAGGYVMNKEKLWAAAEERLHSLYVDDAGQIQMRWRRGSRLALIPGVDSFRIIGHEEHI